MLVLVLLAAAPVADALHDAALAEMAEGKHRAAARRLAAAEPTPARRCLEARAWALAGEHGRAAKAWQQVPEGAPCHARAPLERADALRAEGGLAAAAATYAEQGARRLGPTREAATAEWIAGLATRLLRRREPPVSSAMQLLAEAFALHAGDARQLDLARQMAQLAAKHRVGGVPQAAQTRLAWASGLKERRLLAQVLGARWGLSVLASAKSTAALEALRTRLAEAVDPAWAASLRAAFEARFPKAKEAPALRLRQAHWLAERGRAEAVELLGRVSAEAKPSEAARASWTQAQLHLRTGDLGAAVKQLEAHLSRFPADATRSEAEQALDVARLVLARQVFTSDPKASLGHYDALVARDPKAASAPRAAYEAGLAARALKQPAEAERRWRELAARWPGSDAATEAVAALARVRLYDQSDHAAALELLRGFEEGPLSGAASAELERIEAPSLAVDSVQRQRPGRDAKVRVVARNIEWVEARFHRIDAEAFLRAGGTPEGLTELDVAVIAPDRRWRVKVPRYAPGRDVDFDLALPKPKPGVYVVTVSGAQREAKAVLLVSDLQLIARTVGPDLAAAVLRDGQPVGGARVLSRTGGKVAEGKTAGSGLYRARLDAGALTLLALHRGSPALLSVDRDAPTPEKRALNLSAELDRAHYLPGDTLRFRVWARRGSAPVKGPIKVFLDEASVTLEASPEGSVHGSLLVSFGDAMRPGRHKVLRNVSLRVQVPGAEHPVAVASAKVMPVARSARSVWIDLDGVAHVREADGAPAVGVALEVDAPPGEAAKVRRTDARGQLKLPAPAEGRPWTWRASLPGTDLSAKRSRRLPEQPPLALGVQPGADLKLRVEGAGQLEVARLSAAPEAASAPADPWVKTIEARLDGPRTWQGPAPAPKEVAAEQRVWSAKVTKAKAPQLVTVPTLAPGRYVARLVSAGGSARADFVVGGALAIHGARDAGLGETLALSVKGGPALLTVEGEGLIAAALQKGEAPSKLKVGPEWGQQVSVAATGAKGEVAHQTLRIDTALKVELKARAEGPRWVFDARVLDHAGAPVRGEVSLRVVDAAIPEAPPSLSTPVVSRGEQRGAVAGRWAHATQGAAVSAQLLAEDARREEARRARNARTGALGNNSLGNLFDANQVPIEVGGLGISGFGAGGGGMGRGRGSSRPGIRLGRARVAGRESVRGWRGATPWAVLRSDAEGRARLVAAAPRHAALWSVEARALAAGASGHARAEVDTRHTARLIAPELSPGAPGESAPLRVRVVNGAQAAALTLVAGERREALKLAAGEAKVVDLGEQKPGAQLALKLVTGAQVVDALDWRWPLREGPEVLTVAIGPGGGLPLSWWAMQADPSVGFERVRAARAGRAALAVLPYVKDSAQLLARAAALRAALSTLPAPSDAAGQAEVLLFLAEAKGPLGVHKGELEKAAPKAAPGPDPEVRVAVLHARALAGLSVDEASLARLVRQSATLPAETQARLARVLHTLGREVDAKGLSGEGPQTILARRALKLSTEAARAKLVSGAPPAVGSSGRAAWLAAVAKAPAKKRGQAKVRFAGRSRSIDLGTGGVLRFVGEGRPEVSGAAEPWFGRGAKPPSGAQAAGLIRVPIGAAGGVPRGAPTRIGERDARRCESPCTLAVGDALLVSGALDAPGWQPPAGLRRETDARTGRRWLRALAEGSFTLAPHQAAGAFAPEGRPWTKAAQIVVGTPKAGALSPAYALGLAEEAAAAGADPSALLSPWPRDQDWPRALHGRVAALRFRQAKEPAHVVDRFEALRDAWPSASLTLEDVARVAQAYGASGAHARAIDVWRAGLGLTFLGEAAAARRVEAIAGPLASMQGLRSITARYPSIPQVQEALFRLPQRLGGLADAPLTSTLTEAGVTATDLRLMAAAWDREFLAWWPKGQRRGEVGFHLVRTLLQLDADARAASWAASLARTPDPLQDGLLYLEGLARSRLGEHSPALKLFERVATESFPQADGRTGPARSKADARYAAARVYEARGDLKKAKAAYEEVSGSHPEARRATAALATVLLEPEALRRGKASGPARLKVRMANLEAVNVRAYRLDLRTLFLRDSGVGKASQVRVSGVSPTWSGRLKVKAGPFPAEQTLTLPLQKAGAYLIQLDGGGQQAVSLLLRSDLALEVNDDGQALRARVQRRGKPAANVELRALAGGEVAAARTDVRGVALLPSGAQVLAFAEEHYAFTEQRGATRRRPSRPSPRRKQKFDFGGTIQERMNEQLQRNDDAYEKSFGTEGVKGIEAELL